MLAHDHQGDLNHLGSPIDELVVVELDRLPCSNVETKPSRSLSSPFTAEGLDLDEQSQ